MQMIQRNTSNVQSFKRNTISWQRLLSDSITDPAELLALLELPKSLLVPAQRAAKLFPLRVTRSYVARMQKCNPHDPLLRQVLPLGEEFINPPEYQIDPLNEQQANKIPGLLHKYKNRVLLTLSGACAINCRYCFRRHFAYAENNPGRAGWDKVIAYINADQQINEVIFSGGDPLIVNDRVLADLIIQLSKIPHLKRLRIHSRLPIVLPERVTPTLINGLISTHLKPIVVVHCNHPHELDNHVLNAFQQLHDADISLFNQAVLLKGVNDNINCLIELSEQLYATHVLPYYLHRLDKVQGAAHFDVSDQCIKQIMQGLLEALPGYLVPKFVYEEAGAMSKIPVF